MSDLLVHEPGATPLSPEDLEGLIPTYIVNRAQLNAAEQANILSAVAWASRRRLKPTAILDEKFAFRLHARMFADVWRWAGQVRERDTTPGVDRWMIPIELRNLLENAKVWVDQNVYPGDEIALRLKHRMVWIHPFRNGNGRYSRMIADLTIRSLGGEPFTWGNTNLEEASEVRKKYIAALQAADNEDIAPLVAFARS